MLVAEKTTVEWPPKYDVLGVHVSATTYDECVEAVSRAAADRRPAIVSFHAVHALVTASGNRDLCEAVNQFSILAPDGQPVRWALNWLHHTQLQERVYGPEFMLRMCSRAAREGIPIYLYGGSQTVIDALREVLPSRFPGLSLAGAESPPFRELTAAEDEAVVQRIKRSGARIVFIGLGAPKQDSFAHAHRDRIDAVQVCVGAAFDFHAGTLPMAPVWMQRLGLEWLFRLAREPRRLWRRYLLTNTAFVARLIAALLRTRVARRRPASIKEPV